MAARATVQPSGFQLVDESFIVSVLAQSGRPAGLASSWRVESTPHGGPQGVRETRWQTDTGPSDPRSEDLGSEKIAEIARPGGTWPQKRPSSTNPGGHASSMGESSPEGVCYVFHTGNPSLVIFQIVSTLTMNHAIPRRIPETLSEISRFGHGVCYRTALNE